jgi:isoquinoline 1-oxidoreductase alpha subunit
VTSIEALKDQNVTTIEGLAKQGQLTPIQQAWIKHDVPQCGYCQAGQIMAATDLLNHNPNPSDDDIVAAMSNICRCGTYVRIKKAIHEVAETMQQGVES